MAHLIDKDLLVAEIEKRIEETQSIQPKFDQFWAGQISAFKGVLKILDTHEVKEVDLKKEPASEDFESEWKRYCDSKGGAAVTINFKDIAKHFTEWQKSQDQQTIELAEEHAMLAGMNKMEEEMMKDAIESEVKWCNHGYPNIHMEDLAVLDEVILPKDKFKIGDKVKVIILKDE